MTARSSNSLSTTIVALSVLVIHYSFAGLRIKYVAGIMGVIRISSALEVMLFAFWFSLTAASSRTMVVPCVGSGCHAVESISGWMDDMKRLLISHTISWSFIYLWNHWMPQLQALLAYRIVAAPLAQWDGRSNRVICSIWMSWQSNYIGNGILNILFSFWHLFRVTSQLFSGSFYS